MDHWIICLDSIPENPDSIFALDKFRIYADEFRERMITIFIAIKIEVIKLMNSWLQVNCPISHILIVKIKPFSWNAVSQT